MSTKYLRSGVMVWLIQQLDDGNFLVDPYVYIMDERGNEEEIPADAPMIVSQVYDEPPHKVINKTIASLTNTVIGLRKEKIELERQIRTVQEEYGKSIERFKIMDDLRPLNNYLDGIEPTHYIVHERIPYIELGHEVTNRWASKSKKMLLYLFGDSGNSLTWSISEYNDGSWKRAEPCYSEEEAVAKISQIIEDKLLSEKPRWDLATAAVKYGVELPLGYKEKILEAQNKYDLDTITNSQRRLKEARQRMLERENKIKGDK